MEEGNIMMPRRVGLPTKEEHNMKILVGKPTLHIYHAKRELSCK
jgi:hypothetical protein